MLCFCTEIGYDAFQNKMPGHAIHSQNYAFVSFNSADDSLDGDCRLSIVSKASKTNGLECIHVAAIDY